MPLYNPNVISITGTANQIIASSPTGAVTLSTPQDIATGSTPTFGGLTVQKDQNTATIAIVSNQAALGNTSARAAILVSSIDSGIYVAAFPSDFALDITLQSRGVFGTSSAATTGLDFYAAYPNQYMRFFTGAGEVLRFTSVNNVKLAGTAVRATTEGTNHLDIFNGAAPVGTLANGISLYSTAGELRVMDATGTATLLSPHDEKNYWVFDSIDTTNGKKLHIDVEKLLRFVNDHFGLDFIKGNMTN